MKHSMDLSNSYMNNQNTIHASLDTQAINVYLSGNGGRNSPQLMPNAKTGSFQTGNMYQYMNPIYMTAAGIPTGGKEKSPQPTSQKNTRTNTILQTAATSILK